MAYYFRRSVLPSRLVTRQVMLSQPQQLALRNSKPVLFRSSLSRSYTKMNNVSCSVIQSTSRLFYSTKANENNKESVEKNENVEEEKEETIVEETEKHGNEIEKTPPPPHSRTFSDESSPYFAKFVKETVPTAFAHYFIGGVAFFISGDNLYSWYRNKCDESLLNETVEKGTRPKADVPDDELISRSEVVGRLKKIFQPHKSQSFYHVVCGEHGTGKTTLTRIASREVGQDKDKGIQGGMGVIYVDVPSNTNLNKFGDAFGKALNFSFEEHSYTKHLMWKIFGKAEEDPKWERAMDAFKRAAEVYKEKHKKPPIIVYDNVSRLIRKNPEILDILQDDAKDNADDRKYIAVFVSSEGSVPRRMESRSAWSRADKPVMEIGDLSKEESIKYLVNKKVKKEEIERLYELVGGRIVDLKSVSDKSIAGQTFKVIKQQVLTEVEKKFQTAQLHEKQLHHEVGKHIISSLLKFKELNYITYMKFFNKLEESDEMLEKNVFAYHPEKNTVTFQSQSIEYYIRENLNMFTK